MKYVSTFIISVFIIAISCSNSEQQAEEVKLNDYMDTVSYSVGVDIGKSFRYQEMDINPKVLAKGLEDAFSEKEIELTEKDACEALMPILNQILGGIKEALENTPPELSADLIDMGLVLTGGGALLKNIDKLISQDTGLPVTIADDPLSCVAIGTGRALENEELFSTMLSEY